jgi:biotin carboxyl carrier protein
MAELMSVREFHWRVGGDDIACRIEESKGHGVFHMLGKDAEFTLLSSSQIEINGKRHRFYVVHDGDLVTVWLDGHTYQLHRARKSAELDAAVSQGTGDVRTLMPGKLLQLTVQVGDMVKEKQTVAVMESMKMESPLAASMSGRVSEIYFKPGDVLDMGAILMIIEPTETSA